MPSGSSFNRRGRPGSRSGRENRPCRSEGAQRRAGGLWPEDSQGAAASPQQAEASGGAWVLDSAHGFLLCLIATGWRSPPAVSPPSLSSCLDRVPWGQEPRLCSFCLLCLLRRGLLGGRYFQTKNLVLVSVLNSPRLCPGFPSLTAGPGTRHTVC